MNAHYEIQLSDGSRSKEISANRRDLEKYMRNNRIKGKIIRVRWDKTKK